MTEDLIGTWSSDYGYHSSMQDEELVFRPNGEGSVAYARPGSSDCVLFRWAPSGPDSVLLTPHRSYRDENGAVTEREIPAAAEFRYRLEQGIRPLLDHPLPVLVVIEHTGLLVADSYAQVTGVR
ncbi:hypothetical protein [Nocardia asteroides]|uniref:hypothetical protein n=1 Tax=Nocardia asteroides TaxID=1824 RepID=UPI001E49C738|nr:hypothetical protein [Nocardia asteroides]UGT64334.1 hypothetical protein LTT61_14040 [Nocardia asteroides]